VAVTFRRGPGQTVFYTTDDTEPTARSNRYLRPVVLTKTTTIRARTFPADGRTLPSGESRWTFRRVDPLRRIDANLDFDWRDGSPGGEIPSDQFTAEWRGYIRAPLTGELTVYESADDGVRVRLGGWDAIRDWAVHGPRERSARIHVTAGQLLSIEVDYFERDGGAMIRLEWSGNGLDRQVIPPSAFFQDARGRRPGLSAVYRIRTDRP